MSYSDLLDRMKGKDTDAFLEMTERYGWPVYSAIRRKYADRVMADRIYNETMNRFYHSLSISDAEDPLEALLCAFADQISPDQLKFDSSITANENKAPEIKLLNVEPSTMDSGTKVRRKKGFLHHFSLLFLMVVIALLLWFVTGLLMEMNFIPYYDLGYSWFTANLVQFFRYAK